MEKLEEIYSIKEMMERIGLDPNHIIRLEYRKCQHYLKEFILKSEPNLIKLQELDGMDIVSDNQRKTEKTLSKLIFIHNKMIELERICYAQKEEIELLNERIKNRK